MIDLIKKLITNNNTSSTRGMYESRAGMDESIFAVLYVWAELRSKDPNTKVGSAIYDASTGALHMGYNGFNHGIPDEKEAWDNRNVDTPHNKYTKIVHAEANAMMKALRAGFKPEHSTIYCTHWPCHRCLKDFIIPSGIKTIKYLQNYPPDPESYELLRHTDIKIVQVRLDFSGL